MTVKEVICATKDNNVNTHYLNRYNKFIRYCKEYNKNLEFKEIHHIIPKCLGGANDISNLVPLTPRQHYIAHMLLAFTYRKNISIVSAFCQMAHKNGKRKGKYLLQHRVYSSRVYQKLKQDFYDLLSKNNKNKVYVRDENNTLHRISSDEYKQSNFQFHTKGMVYVFSKKENKPVYITSNEYHQNKKDYVHHSSLIEGHPFCNINFVVKDLLTGITIKISNNDWIKIKHITYKRIDKVKPIRRYKVIKTFDDSWRYKVSDLRKNTLYVFDTITKQYIVKSISEYNPQTDFTNTKNKVVAKDNEGNVSLVSTEDFKSGNYVGVTKGYCMVYDTFTNTYTSIPQSIKKQFPDRYIGHLKKKIPVVHKLTGERIIINKDEYDRNMYCALGNKKFLLKGYNINDITKKIKNINYYEYLIHKENYVIIEAEKLKILSEDKNGIYSN